MKIELKRISFNERMSEETNCFVAEIYINGKKAGYCKNDGKGGCTNYNGNILIREAEAYCKTLPNNKYGEQSFEDVINNLLDAHLKDKDFGRIEKKMHKTYLSAICYGKKVVGHEYANGYEYATVFWKGKTLSQIPLQYLQKAYDDIKANKLQNGDVVLNNNLEALGVKV